jgi:hypothetical protein
VGREPSPSEQPGAPKTASTESTRGAAFTASSVWDASGQEGASLPPQAEWCRSTAPRQGRGAATRTRLL